MTTMKALQMKAYGGSEVLVYQDTPKPEPQAGEVLIRVYAAGVNGIDWKIRDGELQRVFSFQLPMILGLDVAGTVAAVGAGVTAFQVGQDVYGTTERTRGGSFAEFAIANVDAIAPKPKSLNYVEAASIPAVALTAWQALFDKGSLTEGQTVLIHGAAGGVGMFAVQLAKWKGAKVIATASTSKLETVRSLGADKVIDYTTTHFETKVSGVDLVLDVLGGETRARSWQVLKPNGILVSTEIRQGKTVADAAQAAGIQHFVYSAVGSAERNTGIPHFDSKFQVEEYIRASELPYTILRPVFFFYNYNTMRPMVETGTLFQPLSPETKVQQLSEEDYGEMVADVFDRPADFMKREIELTSVDMTMPEIAAAFSRVLGKTVQYQQIPFEAFEQQIGEELTIMCVTLRNTTLQRNACSLELLVGGIVSSVRKSNFCQSRA